MSSTAQAAQSSANQMVLVTSIERDAIESTELAFARLSRDAPGRLNNTVVAVVCSHAGPVTRIVRRLHGQLGADVARIVVVPHDPMLAAGGRLDPARLRPATREAYLTLVAIVGDGQ